MRTLNSEIFMPNENPNYNKDISLIVIYPGSNMSQFKSELTSLKPWFSKYVVAIPDEPNINWETLKDQIDIKVGESDYNITDVTIGVYEDSVDILDDLESIKPRNLLLFNPTPTSNLLESVKKVTGSQSTSANLYYSYKSDKTNVKIIDSLKSLSKNILIGTASITDLYSKWGTDIETHLTKLKLKTLEDDVVEFTNKYESKDSKSKIKLILEDAREGDNKGNPLDIDVVQVFYAGDQLKLKVFLDDTDRRRDEYDKLSTDYDYLFNSQDEYYEQKYSGQEEIEIEISEGIIASVGQELLQGIDFKISTPIVTQEISSSVTGKIRKMIEVARSEIGYIEGSINKAAGKDTKYGVHFGLNGHHYCGMFVNWCAEKAGFKTTNRGGSGGNMPNVIACPTGVKIFKDKGCFVSNGSDKSSRKSSTVKPEPGDVAFFNWSYGDSADHVGIVQEAMSNGKIKCIEGNTSGGKTANAKGSGVWEKIRSKELIIGYGKTARYNSLVS